jgi:hypothetical protein
MIWVEGLWKLYLFLYMETVTLKVKITKSKDDSYLTYKTLSSIEHINALSFYHSNFDRTDARTFLKDYLKDKTISFDISLIDKIPEPWIPLTAAWIARLLTLGCTLPTTDNVNFIISRIEAAIMKIKGNEETENESLVQQDPRRVNKKKVNILAEIDGIIDDNIITHNTECPFYDWLKIHEVPGCYATVIIDKLTPVLKEYEIALDRKSKDLQENISDIREIKEGYSHLTKPAISFRIKAIKNMIECAQTHHDNAKKERKPRKKRTITSDMRLKFFKWKKEDVSLKLVSIDPSKILGAEELYVFDTKYRKITRFVAEGEKGLDVYRTAITNFDKKLSHTYLVGLKKTQYLLTHLFDGGKVNKRRLVEQLNIAPKLCERINEDIILIAAYEMERK